MDKKGQHNKDATRPLLGDDQLQQLQPSRSGRTGPKSYGGTAGGGASFRLEVKAPGDDEYNNLTVASINSLIARLKTFYTTPIRPPLPPARSIRQELVKSSSGFFGCCPCGSSSTPRPDDVEDEPPVAEVAAPPREAPALLLELENWMRSVPADTSLTSAKCLQNSAVQQLFQFCYRNAGDEVKDVKMAAGGAPAQEDAKSATRAQFTADFTSPEHRLIIGIANIGLGLSHEFALAFQQLVGQLEEKQPSDQKKTLRTTTATALAEGCKGCFATLSVMQPLPASTPQTLLLQNLTKLVALFKKLTDQSIESCKSTITKSKGFKADEKVSHRYGGGLGDWHLIHQALINHFNFSNTLDPTQFDVFQQQRLTLGINVDLLIDKNIAIAKEQKAKTGKVLLEHPAFKNHVLIKGFATTRQYETYTTAMGQANPELYEGLRQRFLKQAKAMHPEQQAAVDGTQTPRMTGSGKRKDSSDGEAQDLTLGGAGASSSASTSSSSAAQKMAH